MLEDNTNRIMLGALAVGAVLAPILFMFMGNNWNTFLGLSDKYADAQNVNR